jgi:hypothetical protein
MQQWLTLIQAASGLLTVAAVLTNFVTAIAKLRIRDGRRPTVEADRNVLMRNRHSQYGD